MADNSHKYGFRFARSLHGEPQPQIQRMRLASAYSPSANGTAVGLEVGDPVELLSTGYVDLCPGVEATPGTAGNPWGIVMGFGPLYNSQLGRMDPSAYYPTGGITYSTNLERMSYVWVCPVFGNLWSLDCDDNTTATTEAAYVALLGENVEHILAVDTTNANRPKADPFLHITGHATTNTFHWRIVDYSMSVGQDFSGKNVSLIVQANVTSEAPFTALGT